MLTLRGSMTPATRLRYAETVAGGGARAGGTQEDTWHRAVELLFEHLAVSWMIAGAPIERQNELLERFRAATAHERAWVREALRRALRGELPRRAGAVGPSRRPARRRPPRPTRQWGLSGDARPRGTRFADVTHRGCPADRYRACDAPHEDRRHDWPRLARAGDPVCGWSAGMDVARLFYSPAPWRSTRRPSGACATRRGGRGGRGDPGFCPAPSCASAPCATTWWSSAMAPAARKKNRAPPGCRHPDAGLSRRSPGQPSGRVAHCSSGLVGARGRGVTVTRRGRIEVARSLHHHVWNSCRKGHKVGQCCYPDVIPKKGDY